MVANVAEHMAGPAHSHAGTSAGVSMIPFTAVPEPSTDAALAGPVL
jgi:hypothetical protein